MMCDTSRMHLGYHNSHSLFTAFVVAFVQPTYTFLEDMVEGVPTDGQVCVSIDGTVAFGTLPITVSISMGPGTATGEFITT